MNKNKFYFFVVAILLVSVFGVAIMYIYGWDNTAIFSFTLGSGLIALGFEIKLYNQRTTRGTCLSWIMGVIQFLIMIKRF